MSNKEIWFETLHSGFGQFFSIDKTLYQDKTEHQDLIIFENVISLLQDVLLTLQFLF